MEQIQFIQVTPEQLERQISEGVKSHIEDFLRHFKPKQPEDYLTRKEVSELFRVDLSTIHNWCKNGKLKPHGIGSRVYFKRSELDQSLIPLKS